MPIHIDFPNKIKSCIYLLQIPILALILKYPMNIKNTLLSSYIYMAFLILFGLTIGLQNIKPLFQKVDKSLKSTIYSGFILWTCSAILTGFTIILLSKIGVSDPQGLKNQTYTLHDFLVNRILQVFFIAVSEELFKTLIFIAFLSFFKNKNLLAISISVLLASFIFGGLHGINYKITGIFPIAVAAIPSFIYLLRYNSIYPLMIAHFITDILFCFSHVPPFGACIVQALLTLIGMIIIIKYSIYPFIKKLFF